MLEEPCLPAALHSHKEIVQELPGRVDALIVAFEVAKIPREDPARELHERDMDVTAAACRLLHDGLKHRRLLDRPSVTPRGEAIAGIERGEN